jgi:tripartite-type tricarboxylate transporter receptor subunit TctC
MNREEESMIVRRRAILAAPAVLAFTPAAAQAWPTRPVSFVSGAPPGGTVDLVARTVAQALAPRLGQPVVVDVRPGASFNISVQHVLRQPADGYTLGLAPITMGTNPALMNVGYDPIADIVPVAQMSAVAVAIIVGAHTPFRTLPEMVTFARANPERLTLGHGGHGTSGYLAAQLLAREAGFRYLPVPFSGGTPILQAMMGGQIDGTFVPIDATLLGQVSSGAMRALAVMQPNRLAALPAVPTTREAGFGPSVDFRSWHGTFLRAGTPRPIVERYFTEITGAMRQPEVVQRLTAAGIEPAPSGSIAEFEAFYRGELARWATLIQALGIRAS